MLTFRHINIKTDRELILENRLDSFRESFGHTKGFGSEKHYLGWVEEKASRDPDGFVIAEYQNQAIGQLELQVLHDDINGYIGYVNLYYLIIEYRNKGWGQYLKEYVESFFRERFCPEYHLRVSVHNKRAIRFYEKCGMVIFKKEMFDEPVLRMYKKL